MPRADRAESPPSFWRCPKCGTPNPLASYVIHCIGCGQPRPAMPVEATRPRADDRKPAMRPQQGRWLAWVSWAYAVVVLLALAAIRWLGERWAPATLLLFAPRWLFLVPVPILMSAAGWLRRPGLWPLQAATGLVVAGPLMGLSLPVGSLFERKPEGIRLRVMTFNQSSGGCDAGKLIALLEREKVQIVCFQEGYTTLEGRPDPELEHYFAKGWHRDKERAIASRFPFVEELAPLAGKDGEQSFWKARLHRARVKLGGAGEIMVASVHMPTMSFASTAC